MSTIANTALNPIAQIVLDKAEPPRLLLEKDAGMSTSELVSEYGQDGGREHPWYTTEKWKKAVNEENVMAGYWNWVSYMLGGDDVEY